MSEETKVMDNTAIIKVAYKDKVYNIIVDKDKEEELRKYKWCITKHLVVHTRINRKKILMSHMLLPNHKFVIKINDNIFDYTLKNLKSTDNQELGHRGTSRQKKNNYRGVSFKNGLQKYEVTVKQKYIGSFTNALHAAYAYDDYVRRNFPDNIYLMKSLNNVEKPKDYKPHLRIAKKKSNLPPGVCIRRNMYKVLVSFEGKSYGPFTFKEKEDAINKCENLRRELETQWNEKMDNLEITRNRDNIAVIRTAKWEKCATEDERLAQEILVDDEDWHRLKKLCVWQVLKSKYCSSTINGKKTLLHRFLTGCVIGDGYSVDHINNNPIDNRKDNLRKLPANDPIHRHNRTKKQNSTSNYFGVAYLKNGNLWVSNVSKNGTAQRKCFHTEEEAARFSDESAIFFYGSAAKLNFPLPDPITQKLLDKWKEENNVQELFNTHDSVLEKRKRSDYDVVESDSKRPKLSK